MTDQSQESLSDLEHTPQQAAQFLDHITSKYGPGAEASEGQKTRFLLQVAQIQEGRNKDPLPKKIGR